jgi:hypothetical protein
MRTKKNTQAQKIRRLEDTVARIYKEQQQIIRFLNSQIKTDEEE